MLFALSGIAGNCCNNRRGIAGGALMHGRYNGIPVPAKRSEGRLEAKVAYATAIKRVTAVNIPNDEETAIERCRRYSTADQNRCATHSGSCLRVILPVLATLR